MENYILKATAIVTMLLACVFNVHATLLYSDDFTRTEVSDAQHSYTTTGTANVTGETLRLVCPKDNTSGRNYVIGNFGLRNSLENLEADSVEWILSLRQNYDKATTVLNGFDEGKRGVAAILVMDDADPLKANGYALTYGGTGAQQYCLCTFTNGLGAQANLTPFITGPTMTDANKKYWSFRVVYHKATKQWSMYQHIEDNGFLPSVSVWTPCGQATESSYTNVALKYFGWFQNYTGTIDYILFADNLKFSYFDGEQSPVDPTELPTKLKVKSSFNGSWSEKNLQLMGTLQGFTPKDQPRDNWTRSGSYRNLRADSTGFYYVKKIDGRWWLIDPDGYANINRAVCSVPSTNIQQNYDMMTRLGFNSSGNFLDSESQTDKVYNGQNLRQFGYVRRVPFYAGYCKMRHKYYPNTPDVARNNGDYIFALDPLFPHYCDSIAKARIAPSKNERNLVGWFTDNEINFQDVQLQYFVRDLAESDPCRKLALEWASQHGLTEEDCKNATAALTAELKKEFVGYVGEAYYKAVYEAIKKYDPNHLVMGSRLHGRPRANMYLVKASHKYTDITSVNFYDNYQPNDQIAKESWTLDHPCIVGEYYIKDINAQKTTQSGAGWYVNSQTERGYWYQHVMLQFLQNRCYVGMQYFRYGDDPDGSNKGLTNVNNVEYKEFTQWVKQLNDQIYALADFYDGVHRDSPTDSSVCIFDATADTYIEVGTNVNYGKQPTMQVQYTRAENTRKEAFLRFDIPKETQGFEVLHAELCLTVCSGGNQSPYWVVSALEDNSWGETTLTGTLRSANDTWKTVYNRVTTLPGSLTETTYTMDVSGYVRDHIRQQMGFKLHMLTATNSAIEIASREHSNIDFHPTLKITFKGQVHTSLSNANSLMTDNRIYTVLGDYVGCDYKTLPQGVYVQNSKKIIIQ